MVDDLKNTLKNLDIPEPSADAKRSAMQMAMQAFEKEQKEKLQGNAGTIRPIHKANPLTSWIRSFNMKKAYALAGSFAAITVVLAVTTTHYTEMLNEVNPQPQTSVGQLTVMSDGKDPHAIITSAETEKPESVAKGRAKEAKKDGALGIDKSAPGMQYDSKSMAVPASPPAKTQRTHRGGMPMALGKQVASDMAAPGISATEYRALNNMAPPVYGGGDRFEYKAANQVKATASEPVSTFSIDVDTASYSFVRRMLNQGRLPQPQMVRAEEMINYFSYNYPLPEAGGHPFEPSVTVAPSPWNNNKKLVHIGIKGFEKQLAERPAANLVFLIDVSGSMSSHDKLPLVKSSLHMLVDQMSERDTIAIVTYAGYAGTALTPASGADKQTIRSVIDQLGSGGGTAGAAGIEQAYQLAQQHFNKESVNRVILATDGDFNIGMSNNEQLKQYITQKRESGISLSVLGFGQGNYNDALMQSLAQHGNGNAAYIDSLNEARKVLVDEMGATLFTIAKDVKIQVEWNPATVSEYRLVGYETRLLNREDFNNDTVDAGEVGAGHEVTAIYEITPKGAPGTVDKLRYGSVVKEQRTSAAFSGEYGFLKIRYKQPQGSESTLMTTPINTQKEVPALAQATEDVRFAVAVAGFAQLLQQNAAVQGAGYDAIISLADGARGSDAHGLRAEFINLVRTAKSLSGGNIYPIPESNRRCAPGARC